MNKKKLVIIIFLLAVFIAAAALGASIHMHQIEERNYREAHIFVDGAVYPKDAESLDLRGTGISPAHYEAIRAELPECRILWDVPFQGRTLPNDATELTITELSAEDLKQLNYLPALTQIHADGCRDYPQLMALKQARPDCSISYQVSLSGVDYPEDTTALTLTEADPAELLENLQYLPQLETLHFIEPAMAASELLALREAYPQIAVTWEKTFMDICYRDDVAEIDLSGIPLDSVTPIEEAMAYYPGLEKLVMCDCGIDNETMAAFRDRARADYKVVWSVKISSITVRTDDLTFMPEKYDVNVVDQHMVDLVYCEDMLCVDLGHKWVQNLDWIYGMPHLQYLILADTRVTDITPVGTLKELIYFEVFKTNVTDYSPLVGCTSLQDANLAFTDGDASVFAQMPWLKNLWINQCGVDSETRQLLTESLPNTTIEFDHGWHMGNSWRGLENYFRMRDLLEMPYYDWGNQIGRPEWARTDDSISP